MLLFSFVHSIRVAVSVFLAMFTIGIGVAIALLPLALLAWPIAEAIGPEMRRVAEGGLILGILMAFLLLVLLAEWKMIKHSLSGRIDLVRSSSGYWVPLSFLFFALWMAVAAYLSIQWTLNWFFATPFVIFGIFFIPLTMSARSKIISHS